MYFTPYFIVDNLSIKDLSQVTYLKTEDIEETLKKLNLVKYWKGQYVVSLVNTKVIDEHFKKKEEELQKNRRKPLVFKKEHMIQVSWESWKKIR